MKQYVNYDQGSNLNNSIYYYIHLFLKKVEFTLLIFLCLAFIAISKNNKDFSQDVSLFFIKISLPISNVIASPFSALGNSVDYFDDLMSIKKENEVLKEENNKLQSIYIKALDIKQENEELKSLLNFINNKSNKYKSVRLISAPSKAYKSSIIINAGKNQGIEENNIITGKESVIGRVIHVDEEMSSVLTIDDENSKIPVITAGSRQKGILVGHSNNIMTIDYLDKDHKIKVSDLVFTSGDGEHLPPAMLVGVVTKVKGEKVYVKSLENINNANLAVISKY